MRSTFLVLLIGGLLAALFVSSCGTKPKCGAGTCAGCCDPSGMCQSGSAGQACGIAGGMCTTCTTFQMCSLGACIGNNGTGGGSGGLCNSTTCAGCCNFQGQCQSGMLHGVCGRSGQPCQDCTTTARVCSGQTCVTGSGGGTGGGGTGGGGTGGGATGCTNCMGCCLQGICFAGNTNATCGINGAACQQCMGPQSCTVGQCVGGAGGGAGGGGGGAPGGGAPGGGAPGGGVGGGGGSGGGGTPPCPVVSLTSATSAGNYGGTAQNELTVGMRRLGTTTQYDQASFELWWGTTGTPPTLPYTEQFSTASKWFMCLGCLTYREGCTAPTTAYPFSTCSGRAYFAQSGALTFSQASRATTGVVVGTYNNVTLQEWNFTTDVPVSGGACVTLQSGSFNITY